MTDQPTNEAIAVAIVGGGAALIGGGTITLSEKMTRKEVYLCIVSSLGLGCFVPPALTSFWQFDWRLAGLIGLVLGLCCLGIVAAFKKLSDLFGSKPGVIVSQFNPTLGKIISGTLDDKPSVGAQNPTVPEKKDGDK